MIKLFFYRLTTYFIFLLPLIFLSGCALPSQEGRTPSQFLSSEQARQTRLGQGLASYLQEYPEQSGILPLDDAVSAFAARMVLAAAADRTLDIQYYIWRSDITGTLLLKALFDAAERGVRVRLLLDDNGVSGMDSILAALNEHPLIEVRLFNPFSVRQPKALGFITHFSRANRRMHNKSFTADNQLTIIGGRNIGDEYFGATDDVLFADLDVLAAGSVVTGVSADFDRYWHSQSSYPAEKLLPATSEQQLKQLLAAAAKHQQDPKAAKYIQALQQSHFIEELTAGSLNFRWTDVRMVSDDPKKGLGQAKDNELLIFSLNDILGTPEQNIILVSPYFVPTKAGVKAFKSMIEKGISITVLTNALEATDVAAVHAGYAKRRKALLEMGVSLFEMRRTMQQDTDNSLFGSSGSSLHAKTFAIDNKRVFIGSFNFDPRSARLNTELGFIIDSPELAQAIADIFATEVPARAYEVKLDNKGRLYWQENNRGEVIIHTTEPGTSGSQRAVIYLLSVLPIEWLL